MRYGTDDRTHHPPPDCIVPRDGLIQDGPTESSGVQAILSVRGSSPIQLPRPEGVDATIIPGFAPGESANVDVQLSTSANLTVGSHQLDITLRMYDH